MTPELDRALAEIARAPGMRAFGWAVLALAGCALVYGLMVGV